MLYMVVERFKEGGAPEIYRRFREKGRMMPDGLEYVSSWIDHNFKMCWQLVQARARLPAKGFWYPPSFFIGVTASHRVAQEEISGPVLSVMTFRTPEEAIARANNTPY